MRLPGEMMDPVVFVAVLAAAAMHAGWNAVVKVGLDRLSSILLLAVASAAIGIVLLPFFPFPQAPSWGWIVASALIHSGYKLALVRAYEHGDLSQVYPLARGTAPLVVAVAGAAFLGETPTFLKLLAVVSIALGVCLMAWKGGAARAMPPKALGYALATAAFTASYTLVDGIGARLSGSASGYILALTILDGADFSLARGEMVALVAPSGTGKSTLLHVAGLLERPDRGDVLLSGRGCGKLGDDERTAIRRNDVGFVYQFHHLLPEFSALENVMMPQLVRGLARGEAEARADQLLDYLGVKPRAHHRPAELSGGEQQRVAIARAVANAPLVLLADEPTGNLDPATAGYVFDALAALVRQSGLAALIATHNHDLAARMDRRVTLEGGRVVPL